VIYNPPIVISATWNVGLAIEERKIKSVPIRSIPIRIVSIVLAMVTSSTG
jgi:hypothetical protein